MPEIELNLSTSELHNLMLEAIRISRRGFGYTAPNPCVGALLLKDGNIVAEGWHASYGDKHAEQAVLARAVERQINPADCILLVTLEPCKHHGKQPPCTESILAAGIKTVVIGTLDPTPTAGGGAEYLRQHGVEVLTGIAEQECRDNIADFICLQSASRPYTILKLASTLDGRIATRSLHSRWISGAAALRRVHELRCHVQVVMVGGNTFYQDDPELTCRLSNMPAEYTQPLAAVVTSRLPDKPEQYKLLRSRPEQSIFFTTMEAAATPLADKLRRLGTNVYGLPPGKKDTPFPEQSVNMQLDLAAAFALLYSEHACNYALCEGGGSLGISLLKSGLADELHLHLAAKILADNQAIPLFNGLCPDKLEQGLNLRFSGAELCGTDLLLRLFRCPDAHRQ